MSSASTATSHRVPKAPDDNTGLVGVWAFGSASIVKTRTFVVWADGRYAMIDPLGDTQNNGGGPGVEYGTYSHNSTTLALRILTVTVDTNGCAGLQDSRTSELASFNLTLSADSSTASLIEGTESYPLFRISRWTRWAGHRLAAAAILRSQQAMQCIRKVPNETGHAGRHGGIAGLPQV